MFFASWIALLALVFFLAGLGAALSAWKRLQGTRRIAGTLGGLLVAIGGGSFAGIGAASLNGLPATFEWPMGSSARIIHLPDGRKLALHDPSDRVQLYDANGHFVRGWSIDASGGVFQARLVDETMLEIWTARGQKRFLLNPDGILTHVGSYAPAPYEGFHGEGQKESLSTPWPLLILSHPIIAWSCGFAGILMLGLSDPEKLKPRYLRNKNASKSGLL